MYFEQTDLLNIAFEAQGVSSGEPVFLIHGWPDSPASWMPVASKLQDRGFRTIAPYLRGLHPTEFLSPVTPRFAGAVAMAQDVVDLADKLGISEFAVVGHDWGARIAYTLAALFQKRVRAIATLALAYQPCGEFHLGSFQQSKQFWYQFFQCTDAGAEAVRRDPIGFARIQWNTWSPEGWFTEEDFELATRHFDSPDWAEITLNAYRSRYLKGEAFDSRYDRLHAQLKDNVLLDVPTVMIQGASDFCDLPAGSESQEKYFRNGYERILLTGVGHFPHRENPTAVADAVLRLLMKNGSPSQ